MQLSPVEKAAGVYKSEPCARTFREDLEAHLLCGYVYSSPGVFMMARPVVKEASEDLIVNPWHQFDKQQCNAWLVYLLAGDMKEAWDKRPFDLEFIGFERRNVLTFHPCEAFFRRFGDEGAGINPLNFNHETVLPLARHSYMPS